MRGPAGWIVLAAALTGCAESDAVRTADGDQPRTAGPAGRVESLDCGEDNRSSVLTVDYPSTVVGHASARAAAHALADDEAVFPREDLTERATEGSLGQPVFEYATDDGRVVAYVTVGRWADDTWMASSMAVCQSPFRQPLPEGHPATTVATWRVDGPVDARATELPLLVRERACASGQSAEGRIDDPDVDYRRDSVVITVEVRQRSSSEDCPGNPETPYLLRLEEPVGDRRLLDGGRRPPAPPAALGE